MSEEHFEILDERGARVGLAPRSRAHREGLWHRAVHVFVFRSDGRLLIQRRQLHKDICPGAWDLSAAEHLKPGESYLEGAVRGLREELGVEEDVALEEVAGVSPARLDLPALGVKDYELQQSFRCVYDGPVVPDPNEVAEVRTMALDELRAAFAERPAEFTPWFRDDAKRLGFV
jgi:isopentenyl-diphosphate delta-isomerase type 1